MGLKSKIQGTLGQEPHGLFKSKVDVSKRPKVGGHLVVDRFWYMDPWSAEWVNTVLINDLTKAWSVRIIEKRIFRLVYFYMFIRVYHGLIFSF